MCRRSQSNQDRRRGAFRSRSWRRALNACDPCALLAFTPLRFAVSRASQRESIVSFPCASAAGPVSSQRRQRPCAPTQATCSLFYQPFAVQGEALSRAPSLPNAFRLRLCLCIFFIAASPTPARGRAPSAAPACAWAASTSRSTRCAGAASSRMSLRCRAAHHPAAAQLGRRRLLSRCIAARVRPCAWRRVPAAASGERLPAVGENTSAAACVGSLCPPRLSSGERRRLGPAHRVLGVPPLDRQGPRGIAAALPAGGRACPLARPSVNTSLHRRRACFLLFRC